MDQIIDLDRYPLHRADRPEYDALIAAARADLAREGMFSLPGFFLPQAIDAALADVAPRFATEAFAHARHHNIYFRKEVPELPPDHPALVQHVSSNRTLWGDQIGGPLNALYGWPAFAAFLAATMDKPVLHVMDDPLARVNAMSYAEGEALNWHFDRSEFTTTLLLQAPKGGGLFEYRTNLRSDNDPNYDGVARMLRGQDPALKAITLDPGTLNVFRGRNTAHRITPVEGDRNRVIAVFSYYDRPGVRMTPEEQRGFYGRAA